MVVKRKSYRRREEKQRIAEALLRDADEQRQHLQQWVETVAWPWNQQLSDRCDYLYQVAVPLTRNCAGRHLQERRGLLMLILQRTQKDS